MKKFLSFLIVAAIVSATFNLCITTSALEVGDSGTSGDIIIPDPTTPICQITGKHTLKETSNIPATCTKDGKIVQDCVLCSYSKTTVLPAGHTYTNKCDKTCNKCSYNRTISHSYKTTVTKATLTKNGKIEKKCSVCGYVASSSSTIRRIYSVKLSYTSYTYNGSIRKPTVTVKDSAGKTISSGNYTVTYASGRKYVGKYKVTVTFKGNYSGTKTLYFTINPAKTTVSSLTAGSKKLTVNIAKKTSQVTGYQIQYSTSKKFSSYKTKTVTSYKTTKATLSSLKAKTTYYVRVRTYKTVNGTKYYSGWSSYKYKKTK